MSTSTVAFLNYLEHRETFPLPHVADFVVTTNLWADWKRKLIRNFDAAVNGPGANESKKLWMDGFNIVAESHSLFSAHIAVDGDALIGYVATSNDCWDESGKTGDITALSVHPDHWGRGIGRQLLRRAENHLAASHVRRATLLVEGSNTSVVRLYRGEGWRSIEGFQYVNEINGRMANFHQYEKHL